MNGPQFVDVLAPFAEDEPEFGEMSAQVVDCLRPLPDQKITQPEDHAETLLLRAVERPASPGQHR